MSRTARICLAMLLVAVPLARAASAADHSLGPGVHYWRSLDDLAEKGFPDIDDSGVSWLVSYLYDLEGPLKFALELEYFPDGYSGSTDSAIAPQALVLFGGKLYGGVGAGVTASDSIDGTFSDPYFMTRIGLVLPVLPHVSVDLNLNYQADAFNELGSVESDAITLGAILRFRFRSSR